MTATDTLLSVEGLPLEVARDRARGRQDRQLLRRAGRDRRHRRRIRLRQDAGRPRRSWACCRRPSSAPPARSSSRAGTSPSCRRSELRDLRGARIGMVFQEPMTSLNPSMTIGRQLDEGLALHRDLDARRAPRAGPRHAQPRRDPRSRGALTAYPHQFSGGMRQRIMLASVMLLKPALLIADEPTTALDAVVQRDVLELMVELTRARWHRRADDQPRPVDGRPLHRPHHRDVQGRDRRGGRNARISCVSRSIPTPANCSPRCRAVFRRGTFRIRRTPIVDVRNLVIEYKGRQGFFRKEAGKRALHGIDLSIKPRRGRGAGRRVRIGQDHARPRHRRSCSSRPAARSSFAAARSFPAARAGPIIASTARWSSRTRIPRSIRA